MKSIRVKLDGDPKKKVKITLENYGQTAAWRLLTEEGEAVLKRDESGTWMQRSRDNLSPEEVLKIAEVIENKFLKNKMG